MHIVVPSPTSHKGQNGRVLVIGGSKLFHAAAFWSASMASKVVDLVHFTSPAMENNDLMRVRAKEKFWDGIVVPWSDVEHYIEEDDAILIGPGMPRDDGLMEGEKSTSIIVNDLLSRYPTKRWVVDGGALQQVDPQLITSSMIVTPNAHELQLLMQKMKVTSAPELARALGGAVVLAKGPTDIVTNGVEAQTIEGGNAGLTKGGTGDVLAGLVTSLAAKSPAFDAAMVASTAVKKAAEQLGKNMGIYYSASDLIPAVQQLVTKIVKSIG